MDLIRKGVGKLVRRVVDHATGSGLLQEENTPEGERYYAPGFPELIRQAAAESCVLLKNTVAYETDPCSQCHSFHLVMSYVYKG